MNVLFKKDNNILKSKYFYVICVPLVVIFLLNFIIFIIATFLDVEIMDFFANGLKSRFLTIYSQFYHLGGNTEIYIPFCIVFFILLETLSRRFSKDKQTISRLRWVWFGLLIAIWVGVMSFQMQKHLFNNFTTVVDGVAYEFNLKHFLKSSDYHFIMPIIFVFQLVYFIGALYLLKIKVLDKPTFVEDRAWIKAVEMLIFFALTYVLVICLKIGMGRDYYRELQSAFDFRSNLFKETYGIQGVVDPNSYWYNGLPKEYTPWWKPNGLIGNMGKISNIWNNDIGMIFEANAFPSGHMAATGLVGYMFFTFFYNHQEHNSKLNKYRIALFVFWNVHMLLMDTSFLINGFHWQTDLSFTWMWVILSIIFTQLISIKIRNKF